MKKIIHLSDLHVGHRDCGEKFRLIVSRIVQTMQPASDYVIVITGDLVENAYHNEQRQEALQAIAQLKQHQYTVLVAPGNHDYGTGAWANPKFVDTFKHAFYGNTTVSFPKTDVVDGVLFIALDSNAEELNWYDRMFAEGELGRAQLNRLEQILADAAYSSMKKVVYMHHHPIDKLMWHQLKDAKKLMSVIENKVDVLLFGHLHRVKGSATKQLNGTWGIGRVYNAGSATRKNGNSGCHRIIDLENGPDKDVDGAFI